MLTPLERRQPCFMLPSPSALEESLLMPGAGCAVSFVTMLLKDGSRCVSPS